ncbi:hypothetical protein [Leptospira levettii]|uniref:Uncharacterized protein n=1 Tax=Leptospira levettii TaxID=2023178 RepID=A0ABY2MKA2_9LEPT|nr:hypothetical protein [Leptospira levettii]PKA25845.1 hypothetical protein CH381_13195 [Leptospira sp. mixed culture ATI2-C-A1]TGL67385.1 hypothetical protein EHQ60_18520 [Leptospira levettii]TGM83411.1 hypothetical protein EHR00_10025 [Leptospira levettii]
MSIFSPLLSILKDSVTIGLELKLKKYKFKICTKILILLVLLASNSHSQSKEREIRNLFTELEPGIFYFADTKYPEYRPYQHEGQTVKEYIRKKIHPVVKDFLKTNYDGNTKELAKYIGNKSLKQFSENCSRNKIILSKEID